jgi:hypothetical protein
MRNVAAVSLAVLVAACAPGQSRPASVSAGTPVNVDARVVGRILESREVTIFETHLAIVANSHIVEPRDRPGGRLVLVGMFARCAITENREQLYAISYRPMRIMYSINDEDDRRFHTDLAIETCVPIAR